MRAKKAAVNRSAELAVVPKKTIRLWQPRVVKLLSLKGDVDNPREIAKRDLDALKRSIDEFGLVEPFVARA